MAANSNAYIHTIEPDVMCADIATKIYEHAGFAHRITVHLGTLQTEEQFVKDHGKFDFIFIDHEKELYLKDLKELERLNAIQQGTTVFGDNIVYPGSPDYVEYIKNSNNYDSTLYHSYLEYSNYPDGVLISKRISE
jgi:catechol O-methyltransferase